MIFSFNSDGTENLDSSAVRRNSCFPSVFPSRFSFLIISSNSIYLSSIPRFCLILSILSCRCLNVYFRNRNSQCQLQHSAADFRIRHHCCKHKRIPYCQIFEFSGFHSSVLSETEELFGLSIMQKNSFYKKKFSTKFYKISFGINS